MPRYLTHFRDSVLPHLYELNGFLGASVMHREVATGEVEIVVQTRWQSMLAVRAFAGDDVDVAVVEDAAAALLVEYDRAVRHFEVEVEVV